MLLGTRCPHRFAHRCIRSYVDKNHRHRTETYLQKTFQKDIWTTFASRLKRKSESNRSRAAEQKLTNNSVPAGEKPSSSELQIGDIVDGRMYLGTEKPSPEFLAELRALTPYSR